MTGLCTPQKVGAQSGAPRQDDDAHVQLHEQRRAVLLLRAGLPREHHARAQAASVRCRRWS